jgi:hypothetical protein
LLAPAFTAPTFQTFRALVVGFIGRVGEHTVTGMLVAARLNRMRVIPADREGDESAVETQLTDARIAKRRGQAWSSVNPRRWDR